MEKGFTMDQALAEASRCLLCHDAPCATGCPADTGPDRFIRKLRMRNVKGAIATIKERNPLGGVCAVVCPTCSLCQQGCTAAGLDRPIRIGQIQRWLLEHGWEIGFKPLTAKRSNGIRVAVIGSGPSGLTCAAELAREGFKVTIFERRDRPGGMLRYGIPTHRLSWEFLDREIKDITALGVEIRCNAVMDSKEDLDKLFEQGYRGIYLATGAWRSLTLDLPERPAETVLDALTFLQRAKVEREKLGRKLAGASVAVIGGGDTAMDAAISAAKLGAKDVSIIYRRSFKEMPGGDEEKQAAIAEGIHFLILTQPTAYDIRDGKLVGLKVVRNRLGEPDSTGRRAPVPIPDSEHFLPADFVVEAIGLATETKLAELGLNLDDQGRIVVADEAGQTSRPDVFAGGDAVRGPSIVAQAVRDGKLAAAAMAARLRKRS